MSVLGVLLIFGAVFAAIFYTLLVRGLPAGYSPVTITAVQNLFGLPHVPAALLRLRV